MVRKQVLDTSSNRNQVDASIGVQGNSLRQTGNNMVDAGVGSGAVNDFRDSVNVKPKPGSLAHFTFPPTIESMEAALEKERMKQRLAAMKQEHEERHSRNSARGNGASGDDVDVTVNDTVSDTIYGSQPLYNYLNYTTPSSSATEGDAGAGAHVVSSTGNARADSNNDDTSRFSARGLLGSISNALFTSAKETRSGTETSSNQVQMQQVQVPSAAEQQIMLSAQANAAAMAGMEMDNYDAALNNALVMAKSMDDQDAATAAPAPAPANVNNTNAKGANGTNRLLDSAEKQNIKDAMERSKELQDKVLQNVSRTSGQRLSF